MAKRPAFVASYVSTQPTSTRWLALALILLAIGPASGCRICTSSEDLAYPSYGGAWQRTIRDSGRLGSLFDPAGAKASELVSREDPITADEIERQRRDAEAKANGEMGDVDDETRNSGDDESKQDDSDDEDNDAEIERLKKELREQELKDVKVIPGDPLPPLLR